MILEGIVTTYDQDGEVNISPMGPEVAEDARLEQFVLKPFATSRTYENLKRQGEGVLHITDDVLLLARAAVRRFTEVPQLVEAQGVGRLILADTCRWFAFEVTQFNDTTERARIHCRVTQHGERRPFYGFNRAKHAVLEAAILATRVEILELSEIKFQMQHLKVIVEKTAGNQERQAFELIENYLRQYSG